MNFFFRSITAIIVLSVLCHAPLFAQIEPFGLAGEKITAISLFPAILSHQEIYLCAGSDSNGIFIRNLVSPDSPWVDFGLADKKITALGVYHWGAGPASMNTIFAGVQPDKAQGDSTFLYRNTFHVDTMWFAADSGLDAAIVRQINSIAGFSFEGHEPPQPIFLGTDNSIYRAVGFPSHLKWNDTQTGGFISSIETSQSFVFEMNGYVWAGGQNDISFPIFFKSNDGGLNWNFLTPTQWHPNGCISLAVDPQNPDTVYAGLSGFVIKTSDGGSTWVSTALQNLSIIFSGLVINPNNSGHLIAGGTTFSDEFILYETMDGGDSWSQVQPSGTISGITTMDAQTEGNSFMVYMGTSGDGVYRYVSPVTKAGEENGQSRVDEFTLYQNYPNPFNPKTVISYRLATGSEVELNIYNLLGQHIRTLVNRDQPAGTYQVEWDGRDGFGKEVANGLYVYQLKTERIIQNRKMVLLR